MISDNYCNRVCCGVRAAVAAVAAGQSYYLRRCQMMNYDFLCFVSFCQASSQKTAKDTSELEFSHLLGLDLLAGSWQIADKGLVCILKKLVRSRGRFKI
eukprot:scaffold604_cov270-Chaetoceros_neogracile.AAC.6